MDAAKCATTQLVLEGAFLGLYKAGVPLSVGMHLQEKGNELGGAAWTGFSTGHVI